jgi:hypothetical protein
MKFRKIKALIYSFFKTLLYFLILAKDLFIALMDFPRDRLLKKKFKFIIVESSAIVQFHPVSFWQTDPKLRELVLEWKRWYRWIVRNSPKSEDVQIDEALESYEMEWKGLKGTVS